MAPRMPRIALHSLVNVPDEPQAQDECDEVAENAEEGNTADLRLHIRGADRARCDEECRTEKRDDKLVDHLVETLYGLLRPREVDIELRLTAHGHLEEVGELLRNLHGFAQEHDALLPRL